MSIVQDVQLACIWEASARKVGNVHPGASFADLEYLHFVRSALAIAPVFENDSNLSVGEMVFQAVKLTREQVSTNTNLGILLLLAPLAIAAKKPGNLRHNLIDVISGLTIEDAKAVYQAIQCANPGGLGKAAEQDVASLPTVTLLEAMCLAADRDFIARQYSNGFSGIWDFGLVHLRTAISKWNSLEAAIIDLQLQWLAAYPDSLIARKNGLAVAEDIQTRALHVQNLGGIATERGRAASVSLDRHLRGSDHKLNPGTTADLIAACLFVALQENIVNPSVPFHWNTHDWL